MAWGSRVRLPETEKTCISGRVRTEIPQIQQVFTSTLLFVNCFLVVGGVHAVGVQVCVEGVIEIFRIGPAWSRKAQTSNTQGREKTRRTSVTYQCLTTDGFSLLVWECLQDLATV